MNANGGEWLNQLDGLQLLLEAQDAGDLRNGSVIAFEVDDGGDELTNANAPAELGIMNANGTDQQLLSIPCDYLVATLCASSRS